MASPAATASGFPDSVPAWLAERHGAVLDLVNRVLARDVIPEPGHPALAQRAPALPAEIPMRTRIEHREQARAEFAGTDIPAPWACRRFASACSLPCGRNSLASR